MIEPMLPEKLRGDLARYVELLKARFGADLVSLVVFGSHARGEARPGSDIDVLIVVRGLPGSRWERYDGLRALAGKFRGRSARRSRPSS